MATEEPAADSTTAMGENTVVDVAASSDDFSTLAQAIEAADLTEALSAPGPITVFAPTNEAFEALPEGALDELLLPENQDLLRQVLTYHVVQQEVAAADATTGEVPTAAGTPLMLTVDEATGDVMVNEAMVVEPDIQASNGIIHGIDQVILPPDLNL
ncbi:MAG: fasciclin domain-containing protein [Nodosilinea sp.]